MQKKSVLAELIDNAIEDCEIYGEGRREDEETGLLVTAEWTADWLDKDKEKLEYLSIIHICIFQDNVLKLSYDDPRTKCK